MPRFAPRLNGQDRRALLAAAAELHALDELRGDFDLVPTARGWRLSSMVTGRKAGATTFATMLAFERGPDG